jgi:hypothetical protein
MQESIVGHGEHADGMKNATGDRQAAPDGGGAGGAQQRIADLERENAGLKRANVEAVERWLRSDAAQLQAACDALAAALYEVIGAVEGLDSRDIWLTERRAWVTTLEAYRALKAPHGPAEE